MYGFRFLSSATRLLLVVAVFGLVGCGSAAVTTEAVTPAPPTPLKVMLDDLAKTGELGSGTEMIRQALEELKATDATKAEDLLKDMDQLEKLGDPAKIKAKATAMSAKL